MNTILEKEHFSFLGLIWDEHAEEQLAKCIKFINENRPDLSNQFYDRVKQLSINNSEYPRKVFMHRDFAPLSFFWREEYFRNNEWKRGMVGGLIFHGQHDNGGDGGAPTYSVNVTPHDGWAIHT
jgi:hypothetical protein